MDNKNLSDNGMSNSTQAYKPFDRPLITFAVMAYNQEDYISDAIEAALSQTYYPLEILISDDCSSDRTYEIILEMTTNYNGPHKILVNRNKYNLGLAFHVNKIFELASGELIIPGAGDDISLESRVEMIYEAYKEKKPLLIYSKAFEMDKNGALTGRILPHVPLDITANLETAALSESLYIGATGAWNKRLISEYGALRYKDAYEDLVLGFRAMIEDSVEYVDEALVQYRIGSGITTKKNNSSSIKEKLNLRKRRLKIHIDVLNQRRYDLIKKKPNAEVLIGKISRRITMYNQRYIILDNPFNLIIAVMNNPVILTQNIAEVIILRFSRILKRYSKVSGFFGRFVNQKPTNINRIES